MLTPTTFPQSGLFEYAYPTFDDKPQHIYVHFITPDQEQAFVTFPHHPFKKAAQLIPVSWFETVRMVQLEGQSPLLYFLECMLPRLVSSKKPKLVPADLLFDQVEVHEFDGMMAA